MSDIKYRTQAGDSLDYICWQHYGRQAGVVEKVLAFNPGLAALGVNYQENVVITLPEISVAKVSDVIRIWN